MVTRFLSILFIIASQFAFATSGSSQSRSFDCASVLHPQKSQGLDLIGKVQKRYESVSNFSSHFEQESYLASLDISENSNGTMYFERPGKMKWIYKDPEPQEFLLNGSVVYLYQPNDKQLVIDQFKKILISDLPVAFLMGIGELEKDFRLTEYCRNSEGTVLTLSPIKEGGELQELKLLVSSSDYMTKGGRVLDSGGNVTAVIFKEPSINEPVVSDRFDPNFPKGIDVTDRRTEHE